MARSRRGLAEMPGSGMRYDGITSAGERSKSERYRARAARQVCVKAQPRLIGAQLATVLRQSWSEVLKECVSKGLSGDQYAVLGHLRNAESAARSMLEAAEERNPMDVAVFGMELKNELRALWRLSHVRGDEWAGMLNFLQSSLARLELESFTPDQCRAVRDVISRYLTQSSVTDDDVYEANRALKAVGFDPWRGLSRSHEVPNVNPDE